MPRQIASTKTVASRTPRKIVSKIEKRTGPSKIVRDLKKLSKTKGGTTKKNDGGSKRAANRKHKKTEEEEEDGDEEVEIEGTGNGEDSKRRKKDRIYTERVKEREEEERRKKYERMGEVVPERDVSRAVKKRRKIAFYQKSKILPTSPHCIWMFLRQAYEIAMQAGLIQIHEDDKKPKKSKESKNDDGNDMETEVGGEEGENEKKNKKPRCGITVSREALEDIQHFHERVLGTYLLDARTIMENVDKNTVTARVLRTAAEMDKKRGRGAMWNVTLVPVESRKSKEKKNVDKDRRRPVK
jgi:hypothetical protein